MFNDYSRRYLSIFFSLIIHAQAETLMPVLPSCEKQLAPSNDAGEVSQHLQTRYLGTNSLKAQFKQWAYLDALDTSEESSGSMFFLKPGQMRWQYVFPEEQEFIVKRDQIIFYQPKDKQAMLKKAKEVLLSDLPLAFIMGVGKLQDSFDVQTTCLLGGKSQQQDSQKVLELTPKEKVGDKSIKKLVLVLNESFDITAALVVDINNNKTYIQFSQLVRNPENITSQSFDFKLPKGVDLIGE